MASQAQQDLALIRRLMEESRQAVLDRGKHFLLWGALSFVGLALTYLAATGVTGLNPTGSWLVILVVGWAASFAVGWRDGRAARVSTLGRRVLTGVWLSMAVTLTLVALAGMFLEVVSHEALPGLMSVAIAPPVLLTALLTGERWLGWVAGAWWLGGALMLWLPGLHTLMVMAAMSLLLMALPGAALYARSRRRRTPPEAAAEAR